MAEDKWKMFKNYMHNELGVTKEDIKQWTKEAVYEVARDYVKEHFSQYDLRKYVKDFLFNGWRTGLKHDIYTHVAEMIVNELEIKLKEE